MSNYISDKDFLEFYQKALDGIYDYDEMPPFIGSGGYEWHKKAVSASWRLIKSNLIATDNYNNFLDEFSKENDKDRSSGWHIVEFYSTNKLKDLFKKLGLDKKAPPEDNVYPPLKEALTNIFNEAGVGFDKECPYKVKED